MIMHPAIKLRHIRAFADIASVGNLSAVARAQGITQPALSRSLSELEDLLGHKLFRREGRRLVLNEAGTLFHRHAANGLSEFEAGVQALRQDGGGRLKVGVLPTVAGRLFPHVALRFRELAPDVILSIEAGPHAFLLRQLREGQIDLMVGRMPAAADMAGLTFDHLFEEDIVLCARAGHPDAASAVPELLRRAPLVLPPEGAIIRRAVDEYLNSIGVAGLRPAYETVSHAVGRGLVLRSDAVWFISRGVILEELERGEFITIATGARFLSGAVGLTRRQDAQGRSGLKLLIQLAIEAAANGA